MTKIQICGLLDPLWSVTRAHRPAEPLLSPSFRLFSCFFQELVVPKGKETTQIPTWQKQRVLLCNRFRISKIPFICMFAFKQVSVREGERRDEKKRILDSITSMCYTSLTHSHRFFFFLLLPPTFTPLYFTLPLAFTLYAFSIHWALNITLSHYILKIWSSTSSSPPIFYLLSSIPHDFLHLDIWLKFLQ